MPLSTTLVLPRFCLTTTSSGGTLRNLWTWYDSHWGRIARHTSLPPPDEGGLTMTTRISSQFSVAFSALG